MDAASVGGAGGGSGSFVSGGPGGSTAPQREYGQRVMSLTRALKAVGQDARSNSKLSERVEEWREKFR
jgi:molybdenum-dependent DNA-binding transcriptional regulator ModE